MATLSFFPSKKSIAVTDGTTLLAAMRQAGFSIPASCGGKGLCGKCRVKIIDGAVPIDDRQRFCLASDLLEQGWRASCIVEIPVDLLARIFRRDGENGETVFWLARPGSGNPEGVALTQQDVREFQLAKGAIAAGAAVLLADAGVEAHELDSVVLAGGFGSYLDPAAATGTGLIPASVSAEKIHAVGNSSLAGARLCLLSRRDREAAEQLADRVGYIELSTQPSFQMAFAQGMMFSSL